MRDKTVTIFGSTGFIGRQVVKRVAAGGAMVRAVTRNSANANRLRPMGAVGQIVPMIPQGLSLEHIAPLIRGADYVVNCIGILHESKEGDFERTHGDLPGSIAALCAENGVASFVHISAIGASSESRSAYARSKAHGEEKARAAWEPTVILRPSIVFGRDDSFFNRFGGMTTLSPFLPLIDGGRTRFQPVYVGNVADAIIAGLTREDARGRTYELGGPSVYTFRELMEFTLDTMRRKRWLLTIPSNIAMMQGRVLEYLPEPPLTRDQVILLGYDNVVAKGALTLKDLDIAPTPLEVIVPQYLGPYRRPELHLPAA